MFRIFDPTNALAVDTISGNRLDLGRYDASGAIIPNGFVIGDNWQIKWDVVLPGGASGQFIEYFSVAMPSLAASFSANVDNSVESIFDRVRIDIGDPDGMIFVDGLLRRTLTKAISRLNRRLGLVNVTANNDFIFLIAFMVRTDTPVLTLDLQAGTITPSTDPYVDLVILQMEEILLTSESVAFQRLNARTAGRFGSGIIGTAGEGVSIRNADGVTISQSVTRLVTRAQMMQYNLDGIRAQLEQGIKDMRWRLAGGNGKDVATPRFFGTGGPGYGFGYGGGYGPF
jgi:hypothetical protein